MNYYQRIQAVLGGRPTDRPAWGYWQHFPNRDRSPRRLSELMLAHQRELDLDFIKLMPYGLFSVVDWGVELEFFSGLLDSPKQRRMAIREPGDWPKLKPIDGGSGEFAMALEAQRLTMAEAHDTVPIIQTIFSPLTSALKMSGQETLLRHLRENPGEVEAGLEVITETTRQFAELAVDGGADGVFYATQMTNDGVLSEAEHDRFVKKYDLAVLEEIKDGTWFNILHIHGDGPRIDLVEDYPVQALSWHDRDSGPDIETVRAKTDKCLVAGVGHMGALLRGTPEMVADQVKDAWRQAQGLGLIIAPGCGNQTRIPRENILQMKKSVLALGR